MKKEIYVNVNSSSETDMMNGGSPHSHRETYVSDSRTHLRHSHVQFKRNSYYPTSLLTITVLVTSVATLVMCISMMTDYWEHIAWNVSQINEIARTNKPKLESDRRRVNIEHFPDDNVVRISISDVVFPITTTFASSSSSSNVTVGGWRPNNRQLITSIITNTSSSGGGGLDGNRRRLSPASATREIIKSAAAVYLVPIRGGIWTCCMDLAAAPSEFLRNTTTFLRGENCIRYLSMNLTGENESDIMDWNQRMQNLSISCVLVCFIILSCSALVGAYGIIRRQLSAILITGVMYLLASVFGFFPLMIIYMKRNDNGRAAHQNYELTDRENFYDKQILFIKGLVSIGDVAQYNYTEIWSEFYAARIFTVGWSTQLGWLAIVLSAMASLLWIVLSKLMRRTIAYV